MANRDGSTAHDEGLSEATTDRRKFLQATGGLGLASVAGVDEFDGLELNADTQAAAPDEVNVLVFSATEGERHQSVEAGNEAIRGMDDRIAEVTGADEVTIDVIDAELGLDHDFPSSADGLAHYDTVVWNNTTGSPLDSEQQTAFEEYIDGGGSYVGIHAAAETHPNWTFYGDLLGARGEGHPDPQAADVAVEDGVHPSTEHLPSRWELQDGWYDLDASPRGDVHVLATVDEDTYDGAEMADGRVDHPVAWCHPVGDGRSWYTSAGHRVETFEDEAFLEHLFWGIVWTAGFVEGDATATIWSAYEEVEVTTDFEEPMSMTVAPDGRIFVIERPENVTVVDPETGETSIALEKQFWSNLEMGGHGIAVDPDFEENGWIYLYYSVRDDEMEGFYDLPYNVLSRFEVDGDRIRADSEVEILRVHHQRQECCHEAGNIVFGPEGYLYLSTGDNVSPRHSDGYAPMDERDRDPNSRDAQGTSSDTSDLRGSIIRIDPQEDGSYEIPDDNLFTEANGYGEEISEGLVRPEIYGFGFRNPFRFDVDPETGWVYMADYGPDASDWNDDRGPLGICEFNQIREAGYWGWPYVRGDYPYREYDWETEESGDLFDPDGPVNTSQFNDGLEELPAVEDTTFFVPVDWDNYSTYGEDDDGGLLGMLPLPELPRSQGGGPSPENHDDGDEVWHPEDQPPYPAVTDTAPMGHSLVRLPEDTADTALPEYFEGKWIIGGWNSGILQVVSFDDEGELMEISDFLPDISLEGPMDTKVGPDGHFYYLDYGQGYEGIGPTLYRLEHTGEVADDDGGVI